jgi:UDP-N-acetyl-D-mannosaminuronic acid transferase (WecB/TagA/CpsF family)
MKMKYLFLALVTSILTTTAFAVNTSSETGYWQVAPVTVSGAVLGKSTTHKVGFHGSAPTVQRASVSQTSVATTASVSAGVYGYTTAAQADGVITLLNEIRAALVEKGIIKGSN